MTQGTTPGIAVWNRAVDQGRAKARLSKLKKWYGIPMAIALVIALIAGGFSTFLGVLIVLGGLGLFPLIMVLGSNKARAANPEIRLVDGKLALGTTQVTVADIESWTTQKLRSTDDLPGPEAIVMFRIPLYSDGKRGVRADGGPAFETATFGWPEMTGAEIEEVREALAPHITAPWVPIDNLRD